MDNEDEATAEFERLRRELLDFVVAELAQRVATGKEPSLSKVLAEAIDRQVERSVKAHVKNHLPDLDEFIDALLERAGKRATAPGEEGGDKRAATKERARGSKPDDDDRKRGPVSDSLLKRARSDWQTYHWVQRSIVIALFLAIFVGAALVVGFSLTHGKGPDNRAQAGANSVAEDDPFGLANDSQNGNDNGAQNVSAATPAHSDARSNAGASHPAHQLRTRERGTQDGSQH
jgi:hypothetical protein